MRLRVSDLLLCAKTAWVKAFDRGNVLKAWDMIGIVPFTRRVYWDLLEANEKKKEVAGAVGIDPELLCVSNMVKILFPQVKAQGEQGEQGDTGAEATSGFRVRKKDRDSLHSCDLWDLKGGATGDECHRRVKLKTEARRAKEAAVTANKLKRKERKTATISVNNDLGSRVIAALSHQDQITRLKRDQLEAALTFRGVEFDKKLKKPELVAVLQNHLKLLVGGVGPSLIIPNTGEIPVAAPAPVEIPAATSAFLSFLFQPGNSEHTSDGSESSSDSQCTDVEEGYNDDI
jgi:hypothetical protein